MFQQINYKISSERAIENLIARYTHLLDKGDFAGVAALFKHGRIGSIGDFTEGQEEVEKIAAQKPAALSGWHPPHSPCDYEYGFGYRRQGNFGNCCILRDYFSTRRGTVFSAAAD